MKFPRIVESSLPVSYIFTEKENFSYEISKSAHLPVTVQVNKYNTTSFVPRPFYKPICNILTI